MVQRIATPFWRRLLSLHASGLSPALTCLFSSRVYTLLGYWDEGIYNLFLANTEACYITRPGSFRHSRYTQTALVSGTLPSPDSAKENDKSYSDPVFGTLLDHRSD